MQIPVLMFDYCKTKQFEYWLNWLVFNINTFPLHEWPTTHSTKPDFYILLPFNYAENTHNGAILITQSGKVPFCFPLFIIVDLFHFISFFFYLCLSLWMCLYIFRYVPREKKIVEFRWIWMNIKSVNRKIVRYFRKTIETINPNESSIE